MKKEFAVFVSHASEDKAEAAQPIAEELNRRGYKVWYDAFVLTVGDSLRRKIDEGLARSRFGVVILSPHFFSKEWPQRELDGLAAREADGIKVILPVWHRVTRDEVIGYSPTLADRLAAQTSRGLGSVVEELTRVLGPPKQHVTVTVGHPPAEWVQDLPRREPEEPTVSQRARR